MLGRTFCSLFPGQVTSLFIPGPWKGIQTLFYGPGSQTHHMSAAFPSRLNQTTLCSVKCFVFVCCQDHYVVQCVVRKRSRPWAPLVPTRPPFTTCWPRSSLHQDGPCGAHSSHQSQLRAEKALLAPTKHMTIAFFCCKKGFPVSGPCSSPRQRRYSASRSEKER